MSKCVFCACRVELSVSSRTAYEHRRTRTSIEIDSVQCIRVKPARVRHSSLTRYARRLKYEDETEIAHVSVVYKCHLPIITWKIDRITGTHAISWRCTNLFRSVGHFVKPYNITPTTGLKNKPRCNMMNNDVSRVQEKQCFETKMVAFRRFWAKEHCRSGNGFDKTCYAYCSTGPGLTHRLSKESKPSKTPDGRFPEMDSLKFLLQWMMKDIGNGANRGETWYEVIIYLGLTMTM